MAENESNNTAAERPNQRKQSYAFQDMDKEMYTRLRAEAVAPYRGLRKFIYFAFGASGTIGGLIFLTQVLAGRDVEAALPNLALQIGIVALMVWLFRLDGRKSRK